MNSVQERVDALDQYEFDECARGCRDSLRLHGHGFASLSPGDATNYKVSIVQPLTADEWQKHEYLRLFRPETPLPWPSHGTYYVATSFGPMYGWNAQEVDTSYVQAKWVRSGSVTSEWTAAVIARFLNTLARLL